MVSYKILMQLGFSEKEAQLYLSCIELGSATVMQLSRHSEITRGSAYDILEEMLSKGYVSKIHADKHMLFSAVDPELLKKRYKDYVRDFELALPQLKGLYYKHSQPRVRYFEGLEGVMQVYEDTLTATTDLLNFANSKEVRNYFPNYDKDYVQKRVKKKIFLKGIAQSDEHGQWVKSHDKESCREIRLLSANDFSFNNEINIYDDKFSIISFGEKPIGVIIESKEIADTQRDIFKMAWLYAGLVEGKGAR